MKALNACLLCCVLTGSLASHASLAGDAKQPVGQVEVSKSATSLPGNRYAWVGVPPQVAVELDKRVQDPKLRQRLQAALDKALSAKGYRRTDSIRDADVALAYRVGVRDVQQTTVREGGLKVAREAAIECRADGCSQIVTQGSNGAPTIALDTVNMTEGGLLVEVLQPGELRVLWRARYLGSVRTGKGPPIDLDKVAAMTLARLPKAAARSP